LRADASALGFASCRIVSPDAALAGGERLREWVADGQHGDMDWMASTLERRVSPRALWSDVRSVVMLAMNYGPAEDPLANLDRPEVGAISVYARHRDYHDVFKGRLKTLAVRLVAAARPMPAQVKVFVDTAPVMEKPLAEAAGIGWQGKHTNLVSREFGSWLFLGSIFTDLALPPDPPEADHCGSCRRCLDVCPTSAFPAPYRLDARRCISYLTIEHKGPIAPEFRAAIGNRVYGCDDCLAVCPWNKYASVASEAKLAARADLNAPPLAMLATLDEPAFRAHFAGSPIKRIGHARFLRNVLIAIGNSRDNSFAPLAATRLDHPSPLVRAMAVWALGRLAPMAERIRLRQAYADEADTDVKEEWEEALSPLAGV
jgi:epoxyqueuosine reductase